MIENYYFKGGYNKDFFTALASYTKQFNPKPLKSFIIVFLYEKFIHSCEI